ncbi:MAG: enoyl-CoA hydratase family protein [Myxococcales bacterium]|nr:enoyl-CoA hydratase family protein [Myxococcales bacterium]
MIAPKTFRFALADDGVGTITLDRPESLNSLTFEVYRELTDALRALGGEERLRALVITGEGRGFCSGGSVHDIIGPLFAMDAAERMAFTRMTGELIGNLRELDRPVVAALNGVAAGAGAVIALACDFRIASERAKIAFLFVKVGLAGADMGAAWLLPQVIGLARATELLMLGDPVPADEALRIGLVHRVVAPERVQEEAQALASRLARGPRFALGMTKRMLNSEPTMALRDALEAEAQAQQICMAHPDFRAAYEAFVAKREPKFQ